MLFSLFCFQLCERGTLLENYFVDQPTKYRHKLECDTRLENWMKLNHTKRSMLCLWMHSHTTAIEWMTYFFSHDFFLSFLFVVFVVFLLKQFSKSLKPWFPSFSTLFKICAVSHHWKLNSCIVYSENSKNRKNWNLTAKDTSFVSQTWTVERREEEKKRK